MKNKNFLGPDNDFKRFGLYLIDENGEEVKCIRRHYNEKLLVRYMHVSAKFNSEYDKYLRREGYTYEVRDDTWSEIYVIDSCPYYE